MGVLLLSYILSTLALSTLASYIDEVDRLHFKRETGVIPSIGGQE